MHARPFVLLLFTTLSALSARAPCQHRDTALGLVQTAAGEPWAGATVHLLHRPAPKMAHVGQLDHVTVTTDERGAWRADVWSGKEYLVYACGEPEADGQRMSRSEQGVMAGMPTVLEEEEHPHVLRRARIEGLEAWAEFAPFGLLAVHDRTEPEVTRPLALADDGTVSLPCLPGGHCAIEIRGANGRPIHRQYVFSSIPGWLRRQSVLGENRTAADAAEALAEVAVVDVPPPYPVVFHLIGPDAKPIAGGQIKTRFGRSSEFVVIGTTDAEGIAVFPLALALDPQDPEGTPQGTWYGDFFYFADGCAEGESRSYRLETRPIEEQRRRVAERTPDVVHTFLPGGKSRGRLMLDAETPLDDAPILIYGNIAHPNGARFGIEPRTFMTDADGRFEIPGRPDGRAYRLTVLLGGDQLRRISRHQGFPCPDEVMVATASKPTDHGTLVLAERTSIALEIRHADRSPAGLAEVLMLEPDQHYPVRMRADRHGRIEIPLPGDAAMARPSLFVGNARGFATLAEAQPSDDPHIIDLDPTLVMTGTLRDADGEPIADARLSLVSIRGRNGIASLASDMCSVHALRRTKATTDDRGRFEMVMPCHDVTLDFSISGPDRSFRARKNIPFMRDLAGKPFDIEVSR